MLSDPIIALNPQLFSANTTSTDTSVPFHGFSAPFNVKGGQVRVNAYIAQAKAVVPATIDQVVQAYCLAFIANEITAANKPGALNSWAIDNSKTMLNVPATTLAAIKAAAKSNQPIVPLTAALSLDAVLQWPTKVQLTNDSVDLLTNIDPIKLLRRFHETLLQQISSSVATGYYYGGLTAESIIARYDELYDHVEQQARLADSYSGRAARIITLACEGSVSMTHTPSLVSLSVVKTLPQIAVSCTAISVLPLSAAQAGKVSVTDLKVHAQQLKSARNLLDNVNMLPDVTAAVDHIVDQMHKQFANVKMKDSPGDLFASNVSTGLLSPTYSVELFQQLTPEDFAFLMPYLQIKPITSLGDAIAKFPAVRLAQGEPFNFAQSQQNRNNVLGSDEPQLAVSELRIVYASEQGPQSTFKVEMAGRIANPTKLEQEDNSIGQLLRLGSYFEIKYGYNSNIVDRVVERRAARGMATSAEKIKQYKEALTKTCHVQVSAAEVDGSQPSIWEIKVKFIGVWTSALQYGLFIGPYNDDTISMMKVVYKQYEQSVAKLSARASLESQADGASGDLIALRRQFDNYRAQMRGQIMASTAAALAAFKVNPQAFDAVAAPAKGKGKKSSKLKAVAPAQTKLIKYVKDEVFVNLMLIIHQLVLPSVIYLIEQLSTGAPQSTTSSVRITQQNVTLVLNEPMSEAIVDEVNLMIASGNEQAGILKAVKVPTRYNEVFINIKHIEQWANAMFANGQVPTVSAMLQSFNTSILHSGRTYYEYPIASAGLAVKDDAISKLPTPFPSIVIRPGDKDQWYVRVVDYEDVNRQLETYGRLYQQTQGKGATAKAAVSLFDQMFTNTADIKFGNEKSIVEDLKFAVQTAGEVANNYVGMAAQRVYGSASQPVDDIRQMVASAEAYLPSRSYDARQYLGPFVVRYAMTVVSFATSLGLLDLEPKKPLRAKIGAQFDEYFYITAVEHVITPHRIRSNVTANSNKHMTLPPAVAGAR
jgi:hypothetical protein